MENKKIKFTRSIFIRIKSLVDVEKKKKPNGKILLYFDARLLPTAADFDVTRDSGSKLAASGQRL